MSGASMARDNRFAKVVGIHPEARAVDLLFLDDGSRVPMVQVMSLDAGTDFGESNLTAPDLADPSKKYGSKESKTRDIYAVVIHVGAVPVVSGFLFPQICQMLFKDIIRAIKRYSSDFYTSVSDTGDFEAYHPSGTYFRIGVAPAHEDLTAKDFDKKWKITKNTDKQVHAHLEVWNGGVMKATVDIDPNGNIAITNVGTTGVTTTGDITVQTSGAATLKAATTLTLDAPTTHVTGNLNVDKTMTATTDAIGGGKSLKNHVHSGVTVGSASTDPPT
jgi:hypothetical protein